MAGLSSAARNSILTLLFNATAWANIADNAASSPNTQIAVALSTADPTASGNMSSSEAAYTSYARQNVNRNSGGWTVTANSVSPAAAIEFPAATGGSETETFASVGKTGGGTAAIHMTGSLNPTIPVTTGIIPRISTASAFTIT